MKNIFFSVFVMLLLTSCADKKAYIFSYFTGNGEDGLHLAYSNDGYHWQNLADESFLKPELSDDKLMRDPCIILWG